MFQEEARDGQGANLGKPLLLVNACARYGGAPRCRALCAESTVIFEVLAASSCEPSLDAQISRKLLDLVDLLTKPSCLWLPESKRGSLYNDVHWAKTAAACRYFTVSHLLWGLSTWVDALLLHSNIPSAAQTLARLLTLLIRPSGICHDVHLAAGIDLVVCLEYMYFSDDSSGSDNSSSVD